MYKGTICIDELNSFKGENIITSENLVDEQSRLDTIINKIQNLIDKDVELSFHERKFYYENMDCVSKQQAKDYCLFKDFYFIEIFFNYLINVIGINTEVPLGLKIKSFDEQMEYNLCFFYVYWKNDVIENKNLDKSGDTLKNAIKKETNQMIKDFIKNNNKGNEMEKVFNSEHFRIVLFSKFIYLKSIEIIETFDIDKSYFELDLNNKMIVFDDKFLVHVLTRHYAQTMKISDFFKKKSHFIEDILPEKIHLFLKDIFDKYSLLKIKKNTFESFFDFKYNNQIYRICFENNKNQSIRISTFFPLDQETEITKLADKSIIKIDESHLYYI